jgi:hypothetical protein
LGCIVISTSSVDAFSRASFTALSSFASLRDRSASASDKKS